MPGFCASSPPPLLKSVLKTLPKIGLAGNEPFVAPEPVWFVCAPARGGKKTNTCSAFEFMLDPSGSEH